jgi:hypothetical protein|tara:strand:+ start:380 stop:556 length:177 start_codon:yes stop_codon:yes gene_type:complete
VVEELLMSKPMFDSTGSLIEDVGEQVLLEDEWVKVKPPEKKVDINKYLKSKEFWRNRQ